MSPAAAALFAVIAASLGVFAASDDMDASAAPLDVSASAASRALGDGGVIELLLSGVFSEQGTLVAALGLGTPSQAVDVILDTGSSSFLVRGADASASGRPFVRFDESRSAQATPCEAAGDGGACDECGPKGECQFVKHFSEGSRIEGYMLRDIVAFGGGPPSEGGPAVNVGCITAETGLAAQQSPAGILGLAQGKHGFLAALLAAGRMRRNAFEVCAHAAGGRIVLGSAGRAGKGAALRTTPLYIGTANGHYVMALDAVATVGVDVEGGAPAGSPAVEWLQTREEPAGEGATPAPMRVVLDSGSTFSYLPADVLGTVVAALQAACSAAGAACGGSFVPPPDLPASQTACLTLPPSGRGEAGEAASIATFPGLALRFESGSLWYISPEHLWHSSSWTGGVHCLGIFSADEAGGRAVLGLNALHGHRVGVDIEAATLSWSQDGCTGEGSPEEATAAGAHAGSAPPSSAAGYAALSGYGFGLVCAAVGSVEAARRAMVAYRSAAGVAYAPISAADWETAEEGADAAEPELDVVVEREGGGPASSEEEDGDLGMSAAERARGRRARPDSGGRLRR